MIDINRIRNNKEEVEKALLKRMDNPNLDELLILDTEKRKLGTKLDELRYERKKVSDTVPEIKKNGGNADEIIKNMQDLGTEIDNGMIEYRVLEEKIFNFLSGLPNTPDDDILGGGKENNEVVKTYLEKPEFNFKLISHDEICRKLGLIDYERGVKLGGTGSWIYTGIGARLEWALINYFIDFHLRNNYQFMMIPYMLNYDCGFGAGQFPKFNDDVYWVDGFNNKDGKFLLPTAETGLVNLHSGEIMDIDDLPKKYFAFTQCFRREAGSSRADERGTIRGHQFNKVEIVQYVAEDNVKEAFNELLDKAETLVQSLGLHYQLSKLAAGDCAQSMCRTYDIEVWIPSIERYIEVSSVSNSRDYQSRRNSTKYRDKEGKLQYACTLNASGLATSRLIPAIVEQYQNEDGSITIPEVLRPYMGGKREISN
ncbi:MAG: serine--tRNA ligase [Bacilli bacterium]